MINLNNNLLIERHKYNNNIFYKKLNLQKNFQDLNKFRKVYKNDQYI